MNVHDIHEWVVSFTVLMNFEVRFKLAMILKMPECRVLTESSGRKHDSTKNHKDKRNMPCLQQLFQQD